MRIIDFNNKLDEPIALCLGFFDCIHNGHAALVRSCVQFAQLNNVKSALLTFSNDPNPYFLREKQIYTLEDRAEVLDELGVDYVIATEFNSAFAELSPDAFLKLLSSSFDIKAMFIGDDYTFGANADGNSRLLREYCAQNAIHICVVPFERMDGEKLSTRKLKGLVSSGMVDKLNTYLCRPYFMRGVVLHERHVGSSIGFPTANIKLDGGRLPLANGIYATLCNIESKTYMAMTNVGSKPTFLDNSVSVETYIIDFSGDVYGKQIEVSFIKKMRDVKQFSSKTELIEQLVRDEASARDILQQYLDN